METERKATTPIMLVLQPRATVDGKAKGHGTAIVAKQISVDNFRNFSLPILDLIDHEPVREV